MPMRKLRYARSLLHRVEPLVKAGILEKPVWYDSVKQNPPYVRRPAHKPKKLTLPWDHLAHQFVERNPHMVDDPLWLGKYGMEHGTPPLSHAFAKRQYALMQKGLTREEAYKRVEKALHKERMGDVQMARSLVREASALSGGRPSFVSDEGVYDGLRQWQAILRETPYIAWDEKAKNGLDTWLRREVLRYDDVRLDYAKNSHDGTGTAIVAEAARLRVNLFPETKGNQYVCPSDVADVPLQARDGDITSTPEAETDELAYSATEPEVVDVFVGDASWVSTFKEFQDLAAEHPHEADWDRATRERLDAFMMGRCVRRAILDEAFAWIPLPMQARKEEEGSLADIAEEDGGEGEAAASGEEKEASGEGEKSSDDEHLLSFLDDDDGDGDGDGGDGDDDEDGNKKQADSGEATTRGGLNSFLADTDASRLENDPLFAGDTSEGDDGGGERWVSAGVSAGVASGRSAAAARLSRKGWFDVARWRARKVVAEASRSGVRENLQEVVSAAKRQLLPDLVLQVDERKLTDEERDQRKDTLKAQTTIDDDTRDELTRKNREVLLDRLTSEWGAGDPLEQALLRIQSARGKTVKEKQRLKKEEKVVLQKMEKEREKKEIRALAGIEDGEDEFVVTERMNEDLVYMAGVKSHNNFPAKRGKLDLFKTPDMPVANKSVKSPFPPKHVRNRTRRLDKF